MDAGVGQVADVSSIDLPKMISNTQSSTLCRTTRRYFFDVCRVASLNQKSIWFTSIPEHRNTPHGRHHCESRLPLQANQLNNPLIQY